MVLLSWSTTFRIARRVEVVSPFTDSGEELGWPHISTVLATTVVSAVNCLQHVTMWVGVYTTATTSSTSAASISILKMHFITSTALLGSIRVCKFSFVFPTQRHFERLLLAMLWLNRVKLIILTSTVVVIFLMTSTMSTTSSTASHARSVMIIMETWLLLLITTFSSTLSFRHIIVIVLMTYSVLSLRMITTAAQVIFFIPWVFYELTELIAATSVWLVIKLATTSTTSVIASTSL